MKLVVVFDSFKGTLTAQQANACAVEGLAAVLGPVEIVSLPLADGGEGTAAALIATLGGTWEEELVTSPLAHRQVEAGYAWFAGGPWALVEMAAASGLTLLAPHERNPLHTTSAGTGELIAAAARRQPLRIALAVGGSATVDGGTGMARALGWRFLDREGNELAHGGGALARLTRIVPPGDGALPPVEVLCDVTHPLCGKEGAAAVFGPQKGATPAMVEKLEQGLQVLAETIRRDVGIDVASLVGGGAAGGLAAGAVAFLGARLVSGIDTVMQATGFARALEGADWVLTGEGSLDSQSIHGKVISGVVRLARAAGVRVAVLAGRVDLDEAIWRAEGIDAVLAVTPRGMAWEEAVVSARDLLRERAAEWARSVAARG